MAYDFFPKTEAELESGTRQHSKEIRSELLYIFSYLKKKFPEIDTPICMDKTKKSSVKISRAMQVDVNISTLKTKLKIKKLTLEFGNGSSGNRGVNNRGNLFEPQFAKALLDWWEGKNVSDTLMLNAIKELDELHNLREATGITVDIVGGENTKRPLQYSAGGITMDNPKGSGTDVGASVTDVTITKKMKRGSDEVIYLSMKLGTTVTFFNVGVRTVLTPDEIKENKITNKNGKMLLDMFGIDPVLFCMVFNGKLTKGQTKTNTIDDAMLGKLLKSGIGHGYTIVHKLSGKIKVKKMDVAALNTASRVSSSTIYYGGKTGNGKRIDIEVESATYKFKLNIRDTQGKDGYPTRLMCDFSYK